MGYPVRTASELRLMLKAFRNAAGLTQASVASLLGVTQQTYAALELNPGSASMERLLRVLRILSVDLTLSVSVSKGRPAPRARSSSKAAAWPQSTGQSAQRAASAKRTGKTQVGSATVAASSGKKRQNAKSATTAPTAPRRVVRKREDW
ncbi:helix-turn-helix transcriptional regulator [Paraburkholderia jirisanensis]